MKHEKDLTHVAVFGDGGKGAQAKECGWPLKAGKGREMNSNSQTPGRRTALPNLGFGPERHGSGF